MYVIYGRMKYWKTETNNRKEIKFSQELFGKGKIIKWKILVNTQFYPLT